jgi:uncharacterized membrane protein (UPF0136 family)
MAQKSTKPLFLSTKIIYFAGGFLGSVFIVAILLKVTSSFWGIIFALIINGGISIYILKKYQKNKTLKIISIGAISAVVFMTITALSIWTFIQAIFEGIAN